MSSRRISRSPNVKNSNGIQELSIEGRLTGARVLFLNNNMIIVGGSGSGKTESVLKPMINAMRSTNPVAVFTKRSALYASRQMLLVHGYRVGILDLDRPQRGTLAYDPLLLCRDMTDVRDLAHSIGYSSYNISNR